MSNRVVHFRPSFAAGNVCGQPGAAVVKIPSPRITCPQCRGLVPLERRKERKPC